MFDTLESAAGLIADRKKKTPGRPLQQAAARLNHFHQTGLARGDDTDNFRQRLFVKGPAIESHRDQEAVLELLGVSSFNKSILTSERMAMTTSEKPPTKMELGSSAALGPASIRAFS